MRLSAPLPRSDWMPSAPTSSRPRGLRKVTLLASIMVLSAAVLFFQLDAKSLWIDEYSNVLIASQPSLSAVTRGVLEGFQRQPPAYFWILHLWIRLVGSSDLSVRVLGALMALISVALAFQVARHLEGEAVGLLAALLLAASPTFVLYARMARYYLPTLLLGLASCALFLHLAATTPGRLRFIWLAYTTCNTALVLTSYVAAAALICQLACVIVMFRSKGSLLTPWLASLAATGACVAAWLVYALPYVVQYPLPPADLSEGLPGLLVKLAYPMYSFAIGETLFPWRLPAMLGAGVVFALCVLAIVRLRHRPLSLSLLLTGFLAPIIVVVIATTCFVVDVPFLNVPSRALFALPFLSTLVAVGTLALPRRELRYVCVTILLVIALSGLRNYYLDIEFHNPIYAVPMREVVAEVRSELEAADVIVSEGDTAFAYYYQQTEQPAPLLGADVALSVLQAQLPERIWLVTFGRDSTRSSANQELADWLTEHYRLLSQQGYVAQDPLYRQVKARLLHRPAYTYKLLVQLFQMERS